MSTQTIQHPYEFALIKVKDIAINPNYQRGVQKPMVKEIVTNFDYHKVNCVKVVFRDGKYFAFDGQQTTNGLRQKFGEEYLAPCLVYFDVPSWVDEAKLFEGTNAKKARKPVGVRDLWRSRLNRGDELVINIQNILESHNMTLNLASGASYKKDGYVQALDALEGAYLLLGHEKFDEMFEILDKAWHGKRDSLSAPILKGLTCFINTYYGFYRKDRLISKLSAPTSLGKILSGGSAGSKGGAKKYAMEIVAVYNSNCQKGSATFLDTSMLY